MTRHERLNALLTMVMERDGVHVEDIVGELGVSAATARRDLDSLAEQQLVIRTRGGAAPHPGSSDLPLRYRTSRQAAEKQRIARAAAGMVRAGDVVGLNGGTTTTEVAREIAVRPELQAADGDQHVVVVTNAINIANELAVRPHVKVVVTGGVVRSLSFELIGPLAGPILDQIFVDTLFLGVNAVGAETGAAALHEGEASVNAALVRNAERVIVVADSSKLGLRAFARICGAEDIDTLVTDVAADPAAVQALRESGVEVVQV